MWKDGFVICFVISAYKGLLPVPRRTTFSSREVGRGSKCAMASEIDTRTADD